MTDLARERGISETRVYAAIKAMTALINEIEMDLFKCRFTGEVRALEIPTGPNYQGALRFATYVIERLKAREIDLNVERRRTPKGLLLLLSDDTNYSRRVAHDREGDGD